MTETTRIWLIEPAAASIDGWWQGRLIWHLAVRAPSAAAARLTAEDWACSRAVAFGDNLKRAGFEDEKLYHVREAASDESLALAPLLDPIVELAAPVRATSAA